MVNYEDNLTPLGRQMKAEREAMAAQANPALMGIPQGGTGAGGQIKFDRNALMQAYQASMAGPDAGRWFRITGADGKSYAVAPNGGEQVGYTGEGSNREYNYGGNTGFRVFSDPGDFGGGWLTDGPEAAKMNGRPYDALDASGNYAGSGQFKDWQDSKVMGPWGALAVLAMPFAAAAMGLGAGAAGAAGGATAAGSAGAAEAASAAAAASELGGGAAGLGGFLGDATAAGYAGLDAASAATLGGGASGAYGGGLAAASGALGSGAGGSVFNPAVDSQLANTQLGITGSQAAADAAAGAIPSVTVNGAPAGNLLSNLTASGGLVPGAGDVGGGTVGALTSAGSSLLPGGSGSTLGGLGSLLGPLASVAGGAISANASKSAADAQLTATREAAALQEPFRQGGLKGLNRLLDLYGLSGNTTAAGYGSAQKKFGMDDFQADPGYQFRQAEGEKGMQRAASASGLLGSGKFLKDAMTFNQGIASDEYGKAYDRYGTDIARQINPLQALAGQGQSAANTIGEYTTQGGNATAAGKVGTANAISSAIGQGFSMYNQNQMMGQQQAYQNALLGVLGNR